MYRFLRCISSQKAIRPGGSGNELLHEHSQNVSTIFKNIVKHPL